MTSTKPMTYELFCNLVHEGILSQILFRGRYWIITTCSMGKYIFCKNMPDNIGMACGDMYLMYAQGQAIIIN